MISYSTALAMIQKQLQEKMVDHSIMVGNYLGKLAEYFGENTESWRVVGILHDLDYHETEENRNQHGIIAAEELKETLSDVQLHAIQSHDHRTKVLPTTRLDHSLRLVDAFTRLIELGVTPTVKIFEDEDYTYELLGKRAYLPNVIRESCKNLDLSIQQILEILLIDSS